MGYNETPTKGITVNPKLAKMIVKGAIGLAGSAVIGQLIKLERKAEERVDDYFDSKETQEN